MVKSTDAVPENAYNDFANKVLNIDGNGNTINSDNPLPVEIPPCVCDDNSTTTPLLADATFTGTASNTNGYGIIYLSVYSDQASATDGLVIEQSNDGTNWDFDDTYTVPAATGKTFSIQPAGRFVRVKYTNGGTDQTEFRLQTVMKATGLDSSHRVQDNLNDDDDGRLRLSVLKLRTAQNNYVSGAATNNGNFKVSLEELESGISDDTNTSLKVSPQIVDEFGNVQRQLGDNIFKGAVLTIPIEHHEIHCGDSYECSYITNLGNGGVLDVLIVVPNEGLSEAHPGDAQDTKQYHFKGTVATESEATVEFFEAVEVSANGTALNVFCRNRNFTIGDTLDIYHTPTVTSTGTRLVVAKTGSGRGIGGTLGRSDEFILKDNTLYLLRITNNTTTSEWVSINLDYYVHPGV